MFVCLFVCLFDLKFGQFGLHLSDHYKAKGKTAPALRPNLPKNNKVKDSFEFSQYLGYTYITLEGRKKND